VRTRSWVVRHELNVALRRWYGGEPDRTSVRWECTQAELGMWLSEVGEVRDQYFGESLRYKAHSKKPVVC
jgi:hypothetical protein